MSTLIFVDQENGDVGAPKSQLKLPSGSYNTPLPKKAISTSPVVSRSVRKALGSVNNTRGVSSKMDKEKKKSQPCIANKTSEKTRLESCSSMAEEDWPEIENMFPFDPQDFESFDLPEEYKISNIDLCGVPLMVFERTRDRCVKMEEISWESNLLQSTTDFLATVDEIIDMPPPNYDL
ncbi:PTTG1 protein, partial [Pitta sordida]|nr:PTTG1 protein [Pitta sordida]